MDHSKRVGFIADGKDQCSPRACDKRSHCLCFQACFSGVKNLFLILVKMSLMNPIYWVENN